jgi:tRNA pseudouridine55 synthase
VDGILVALKPAGPTSHDIVGLVRRLAATKRVGHGGTLDPFASGVLPLFLGRATRMVEYHLGDRKSYRATVCFGLSSTTDDLEGELIPALGAAPSRAAVEDALPRFRGPISQRPPAYSAIKVAGRRAYAMARAGETVELQPRQVTVERLELRQWDDGDTSRPIAIFDVECSAGTYVRSLARDLGESVGSAAYLGALIRTASGPFTLDDGHSIERIRDAAADGPDRLGSLLQPIDAGLASLPEIVATKPEVAALSRGQFIRSSRPLADVDGPIRVRDATGRLVAIATVTDGRLAPDKVLIEPADA